MKRIRLGVIALVLTLTFFAFKPHDKYFEIAKNIDIFMNLFQEVNTYYVDDVSPTDLMKVGIDEMLKTLDPYTNYIPEDRIEDYRTMTTGEYGGIGITVGERNGKVVVVMPNEGYAAARAGVQIGDQIVKVNDQNVEYSSIEEINKLLRGQSSSEVKLTVKRYGEESPISLKMQREKIHMNNVPYYGMVTSNVGLIQLQDFTRNANREVKNALRDLKDKGADKIILDLRGNPGGLLNEAINISNIFLDKGSVVVSTKGKIEDWNRTHKALNHPEDTEIPIAVLVNGSSASAAEIVSGVIQDYDRGVIIGQRSFGKGLVQATRPLSYNSKLKITVAKYYIPSGRCIQEIDYSSRDEEGTAEKIPDSLKTAFKTMNGRKVYDGGGIMPDIETNTENYAPITKSLLKKGLLFQYASVYRHEHQEIVDPKNFELADDEYDFFMSWLKDKDYDYQTKVEKTFQTLVSSAKSDKYYEGIQNEINALKMKLNHSKEKDLILFKDEIKERLEKEIATHYYLQRGQIEATFDDDADILTAVEILNDSKKYTEILQESGE